MSRSQGLRSTSALLLPLLLAAYVNIRGHGGAVESGPVIALLLPESKTARYETQDRRHFERRVRQLCRTCRLIAANANQDAATQQSQAEAAFSNGTDVLVLDPVDSAAAGAIVAQAKAAGTRVVSYDRLVVGADVDYYVSFDNERVGQLQAHALVDRLAGLGRPRGTIVMINGSPTDNNASLFKNGAHKVIDASDLRIGREFDTPDWSPDRAQRQMEQAITKLGRDIIIGVYAANDGMAGGAVAAMKDAGFKAPLPPVTGQDAELAAIQRVLAGEQYMTVYKAVHAEAEAAAELAVALARRGVPPRGLVNGKTLNGERHVPSVLLEPVAVNRDNLKSTVIKDGFWSSAQVCVGSFAGFCRQEGIL